MHKEGATSSHVYNSPHIYSLASHFTFLRSSLASTAGNKPSFTLTSRSLDYITRSFKHQGIGKVANVLCAPDECTCALDPALPEAKKQLPLKSEVSAILQGIVTSKCVIRPAYHERKPKMPGFAESQRSSQREL